MTGLSSVSEHCLTHVHHWLATESTTWQMRHNASPPCSWRHAYLDHHRRKLLWKWQADHTPYRTSSLHPPTTQGPRNQEPPAHLQSCSLVTWTDCFLATNNTHSKQWPLACSFLCLCHVWSYHNPVQVPLPLVHVWKTVCYLSVFEAMVSSTVAGIQKG